MTDVVHGPDGVVWLDNGQLRLGLTPAFGGRILSLRLGDAEFLWRNPEHLDADLRRLEDQPLTAARTLGEWINLGGDKTWPAPQGWDGPGQWAGPPDPVLDGGPYLVEVDEHEGAAVVTMTSAHDVRSGLRLTRRVELSADSPRLRLTATFTNVADVPVRWSVWNVTQLPLENDGFAEDGIYLGVAPGPTEAQELAVGTGVPRHRRLGAGLVQVPPSDVVGKVGFPTATGWLAHVGHSGTLTWTFAVDEGATYPDGGSRVEVWHESPQPQPIAHLGDLQPAHAVVEAEVLGPLVTLAPGESNSLTLGIVVVAARERVARVCEAAIVHRELRLEPRDDGPVVLTGRITATTTGDVVAATADGQVLAAMPSEGAGSPINLDMALGRLEPGILVHVYGDGQTDAARIATLKVPARATGPATAVDGLSAYRGRGLHGQVVEHLGRAIVGRSLQEGEVLDIDDLERRHRVSRSVLREAMRVLTAKGLLEARQRKGTSVRPPAAWSRLDADVLRWRVEVSDLAAITSELDEVRAAIEPAAAGLAARRRSEEDLRALDDALVAMGEAGSDPDAAVTADLAFHRALLSAAHNGLLSAMEVVLEAALAARNRAVHASPEVEDPVPLHAAVVDAIRAHDPARATDAVHELLSTARADAMRLVGQPEEPGHP